jgi:hypothetical protein
MENEVIKKILKKVFKLMGLKKNLNKEYFKPQYSDCMKVKFDQLIKRNQNKKLQPATKVSSEEGEDERVMSDSDEQDEQDEDSQSDDESEKETDKLNEQLQESVRHQKVEKIVTEKVTMYINRKRSNINLLLWQMKVYLTDWPQESSTSLKTVRS